ncbi:MAG: hypothetical protein R3B89_12365 [Polyangiaceae bacterium]
MSRTRFSRLKQQVLLLVACLTCTLTCAPVANLRTNSRTEIPSRFTGRAPPPIDHIVLLTTDGVRWQDVFGARGAEELPTLSRLIQGEGAVIGAPTSRSAIRASGPAYLSLPGYRELLLGHAPSDCQANDCKAPSEPGLVEQLAGADPGDVAVFASWPTVGDALRPDAPALVSAGKKYLLGAPELARVGLVDTWEAAQAVSPKPGYNNYRPDHETAALGLAYLQRRHPRFLFMSLGDTDEYAHQGKREAYWQALRRYDRTVAAVERTLAEFEARGARTLFLLTTDHGRADGFSEHGAAYPESSRVWLIAGGSAVRARGTVESPRERRLRDVAPTVLLAAGRSPSASNDGEPLLELF